MRLINELDVAAGPEETWRALIELPRVARALPGATVEPSARDGAYRGTMKVRLGPVVTEYEGTALLQDVDDDEHVASFHVQGREARGQGTAAATITGRLSPRDGGTHVVVETELVVTGREAQLGRGIMEDVAERILEELAGRLERELADPFVPTQALDVGGAALQAVAERAALVVAGVALGLALGRAVWRR